MFENLAISRRQIALKIAPSLHVQFLKLQLKRDKNCIELRDKNRDWQVTFENNDLEGIAV